MSPNPNTDFENENTTGAQVGASLLDDEKPSGSAASRPNGSGPSDDEAVDFDDQEIYRRPGELAVCKEKTAGVKHRFSVLPDPGNPGKAFLRRTWAHAVEGKGYAKCFSKHDKDGKIVGEPAFCCKHAADPAAPRFGALVVEYTCIDPATASFKQEVLRGQAPFTFEIRALCLSQTAAKKLSDKAGENDNGDTMKVHQVDYFYTKAAQNNGMDFERMSARASWTKNPNIQKQVEEAMVPFLDGKGLSHRMARTLNQAQMRDFLGIGGSTPAASEDSAFSDL